MRLTLHVFGLQVFDFTATTDEDETDDSLKPPFGFAGGPTLHTEVHEPMLDNIQSD